jgi:hypothetical protein
MASNSKTKIKQALNQPHPGHIEPPMTPNTLRLTHKQIQLTQQAPQTASTWPASYPDT